MAEAVGDVYFDDGQAAETDDGKALKYDIVPASSTGFKDSVTTVICAAGLNLLTLSR